MWYQHVERKIDTNRYLIQKIHIMYIFFLFLRIRALVTAAYNVYYWVKGDRNGFANSKASVVSELVSIQEMFSCAEKLNCWNEIQERSWTHVKAPPKPCTCVSAKLKSCQELCWWLNGVEDPLTSSQAMPQALASAPRWQSENQSHPTTSKKSMCSLQWELDLALGRYFY